MSTVRIFLCCLLAWLATYSHLTCAELISADKTTQPERIITYALWGGPGDLAQASERCQAFVNANPSIGIKLAVYPWGQYWAKLQTQCAAGLAPDIISLYSPVMGVWIERGALLSLENLVVESQTDIASFHESAIASCRWTKGESNALYAMPMEIAIRLLAFDKNKFRQAGIPPAQWPQPDKPLSWDAFRELSRRLTVRNVHGDTTQYGAHYGYTWETSMQGMYGGTIFDRDSNPTISHASTNPSLRQALIEIYQQQYASNTMLGSIPLASGLSSGADNALLSNRFAMGITGSWALPGLHNSAIDLGLSPLPQADSYAHRITVNALGISSDSADPQAAWAFIQFMLSADIQQSFGSTLKGVPALKAAADSIIKNDYDIGDTQAFLFAAQHARPEPVFANTDVQGAVQRWFQSIETHFDQERSTLLFQRMNRIADHSATSDTSKILRQIEEHMNEVIATTITTRLPELDDDIAAAFARAQKHQPSVAVAVLGPILVIIVFGLLGALTWWFFRHKQQTTQHRSASGAITTGSPIGYACLSPWLLGFVCFSLGPCIAALYISFTDWNMISAPRWVGVANYLGMFTDERFWIGLERTGLYALLVIPISLGGGLFTAGLLTCDIRGRDAFKAILYFPSLLTGAAAAVLWTNMFNKEFGVVNRGLSAFGFQPISWFDESHAFYTIVLMNVFWIGGSMIIYYAGMKQIPKSLYEAADIDGAGPIRKFVSITIPLLSPVMLFLVVISTIGAFQIFTPALFVAESSYAIGSPGDSLRFYSVNIYDEAFNNLRMGRACAQAIILFCIIFIITMLQMWFSKRFVHQEGPA